MFEGIYKKLPASSLYAYIWVCVFRGLYICSMHHADIEKNINIISNTKNNKKLIHRLYHTVDFHHFIEMKIHLLLNFPFQTFKMQNADHRVTVVD